jgi:hypothetical protein
MDRFNLSTDGGIVYAGNLWDSRLQMRETWLKPNRRALGFACVPPALLAAIGLGLVVATRSAAQYFGQALGIGLVLVAATLIGLLVRQLRRPRIAYRDGYVLFYLRAGRPFEVPAQFVEAFFLGRGPARLPISIGPREESVNLVARLAQRRTEWAHQSVKPVLGRWCDGYVTISGAWCEPLNAELIRRINHRLKEVKSSTAEEIGP